MRPTSSNPRWFAATVCLLASSGFAAGQEGVVRMSDAATRPGVVRMSAMKQPSIRQTSFSPQNMQVGYSQPMPYQNHQLAGHMPMGANTNLYQPANPYQGTGAYKWAGHSLPAMHPVTYSTGGHSLGCDTGCGLDGGYGSGCCDQGCGDVGCGSEGCCNANSRRGGWDSRRGQRKMRKDGWQSCDECYYGDGYRQRMVTLFTPALPKGSCNNQRWVGRWWRGQQHNYLARNQRLSNTLFGWLVPSGCCGQGCPPLGKYCVTYADDPGYADNRDGGQGYGVQGYGVPMSVPLAPNVRQAYNYSWGTPSSRITPLGQYNGGGGSPQPLYHQSW